MENLTGKNALVTGGGRGIGKAIAIALANEGVNVAITGRTESQLQAVVDLLQKSGVKATYAVADVADRLAVENAVEKIVNQQGSIDILVNNAGIGTFGGFLDLSPEQWEEIVRVNLFGVYYVTRAVLPSMIARKTGDILNISSSAGTRGAAMTSAYSASKFGLLGLTESLMLEVRRHNIRVVAYTPSTIATDLAIDNKLTDGNPDKVLQPEDMAELVIAHLKLNRRALLKSASLWSTNP